MITFNITAVAFNIHGNQAAAFDFTQEETFQSEGRGDIQLFDTLEEAEKAFKAYATQEEANTLTAHEGVEFRINKLDEEGLTSVVKSQKMVVERA